MLEAIHSFGWVLLLLLFVGGFIEVNLRAPQVVKDWLRRKFEGEPKTKKA